LFVWQLFFQVLEQQKQAQDVYIILQEIYTLSERKGLFLVEELGADFIEYMFRYPANKEPTLKTIW